MKIYEVSTDGSSQWVAAESLKSAFDFVDSCTPFDHLDTCQDQLIIEAVPEEKWNEKWIANEDNFDEPLRSLQEALTDAVYFPCLLAYEH
jgi:hypothetical protein